MLARLRKAKDNNEGGFTLIELLVVIIIIGILAAIAIPTFLSQREKGWKSDIKSNIKNAVTAQESYATENNGAYTDALADLEAEGFNKSADVTLEFTAADGAFTISGTHANLDAADCTITFNSADGVLDTSAC